MRPKKLITIMNKGINEVLRYGKLKRLERNIKALEAVYVQYAKEANDFRSGYETQGYELENINDYLFYISDRWGCAFRIRWIIDGIKDGHFKKAIEKGLMNDWIHVPKWCGKEASRSWRQYEKEQRDWL